MASHVPDQHCIGVGTDGGGSPFAVARGHGTYASLSAQLHLHIRTHDAKAAADWYRDVLGGSVELSRHVGAAENGLTVAIVRFDGLTLALHATSGPVATFKDLPIESTHQAPGAPYALRAKRSALVLAPDALVVEIIEEQ